MLACVTREQQNDSPIPTTSQPSPIPTTSQPSPRSRREAEASGPIDPRVAGLTQRAIAGRLLAGAGAGLLPVFLFLPCASVINQGATGWQALDSSDIVMTAGAVAIVGLLTIELLVRPSRALQVAVSCLCFLLLGLAWPDLLGIPAGWDAGAVLTLLTALTACGGALLTLAEPMAFRAVLGSPGRGADVR